MYLKYLLLIGFLTLSCQFEKQAPIFAKKGVLDLREVNLQELKSIQLRGEWEIYLFQFVAPGDLDSYDKIYSDHPNSWCDLKDENGNYFSRDGFATYRIKILIPEKYIDERLGIIIPEIASAYNLYLNGKLVITQGSPNVNYENTLAYIKPRLFKFSGKSELDFIFQISNYGYNDSGFWSAVEFGLEEEITRDFYFGMIREMFLFGSILIMGIYHSIFYIFRKKEISILYFSLFCFLIAIRTIVTGNRLLLDLIPNIPWGFFYRLEYLSFYMSPAPFMLFVKQLFEKEMLKPITRIYLLTNLAFIPLILLPIEFFTQTVRYFQLLLLGGIIYIFVILIRAVKNKKYGAKTFLGGWIGLSFTVIYDIITDIFDIRTTLISSYGFIIFVLSQATILSSRFAKAFQSAEKLSQELNQIKDTLEDRIKEKTKDITLLNQISKELNSSMDFYAIMGQVYYYVSRYFGIDSICLLNVDKNEKIFRTSIWFGLDFLTPEENRILETIFIPLSKEGGSAYITYTKKQIMYFRKIDKSILSGPDKIMAELLNLKSLVEIPLIIHGEVVAVLLATSFRNPMVLKKSQLEILESIGEIISGAIHNSFLIKESFKAKKQMEIAYKEAESLMEISRKISSNSSFEAIFNEIENYLKKNFQLNYFWLLLVDKETNYFYTSIFHDDSRLAPAIRDKYKNLKIPIHEEIGSLYATFKRKKIFFLPKIPKFGVQSYDEEIVKDFQLKSFLQVPVLLNDEVVGILTSTNFGERLNFTKQDLERIYRFVSQIGGAIHNSRLLKIAEEEKQKSETLLLNILPETVAKELKEKKEVEPVLFESATILFTDFVGFTKISESLKPQSLIRQLDGYFLQFDEIMKRYNIEKIKTIGDSYMAAGGLPIKNGSHPFDVCLAALEIRAFMNQVKKMRAFTNLPDFTLRVGIHTGPVIAGVIGKYKFAYDVWGDTVNIASRMESHGTPEKINISDSTYQIIKDFFITESRGVLKVKGKGEMKMHYLISIRPELSIHGEGIYPNQEFYLKLSEYLNTPASSLSG